MPFFGGKTEIIRIVDHQDFITQIINQPVPNEMKDRECLLNLMIPAIMKHRNDIFWLDFRSEKSIINRYINNFYSKWKCSCSYGGRFMIGYNNKWNVKVPICDFDAVSLYPSAMERLCTVEGKPKVISPEQLNLEFLSKQSAY